MSQRKETIGQTYQKLFLWYLSAMSISCVSVGLSQALCSPYSIYTDTRKTHSDVQGSKLTVLLSHCACTIIAKVY